jgi:hypothetical protein
MQLQEKPPAGGLFAFVGCCLFHEAKLPRKSSDQVRPLDLYRNLLPLWSRAA